MRFYAELCDATAREREELLASPVIVDCLAGRVGLATYVAFLTEAYHHVKHTVPLLMACGSRLPERLAWLGAGLVKYIHEEHGHERWILGDIAACGADPVAAIARGPGLPTELLVSFAYDTIQRGNPVGLFGMIYVLEGTSVTIASAAADIIQRGLSLPSQALTYLRSHGTVDLEHIGDFEQLVNRLDHREDRLAVVHCARVVFRLYGDVFRSLPRATSESLEARAQAVA